MPEDHEQAGEDQDVDLGKAVATHFSKSRRSILVEEVQNEVSALDLEW